MHAKHKRELWGASGLELPAASKLQPLRAGACLPRQAALAPASCHAAQTLPRNTSAGSGPTALSGCMGLGRTQGGLDKALTQPHPCLPWPRSARLYRTHSGRSGSLPGLRAAASTRTSAQ